MMVIAFELFATSARPAFKRFYASGELLKIFGTMRSDDLKGVVSELPGIHSERLVGRPRPV